MQKSGRSIVSIMIIIFIVAILFIFLAFKVFDKLTDTEVEGTENPNAEEILTLDPDANIFQYDGVIYKTGIDWVEDLSLTKDQRLGEIKTVNDTDMDFEDWMANKLPVGSEIFSTEERGTEILIVESEGESFKYLASVEG